LSLTLLYQNHILNTTVLELPHTIVGATIAIKIPNPLISLPLALLSHFVLDFVPHWNPSLYTETLKLGKLTRKSNLIIALDTTLSLILGFFIISRFWPNIEQSIIILLACFMAVLPDVIEGFYFYLGIKNRLLKRFIKFQHEHQANIKIIPGLLTQATTIIICLYFILSM